MINNDKTCFSLDIFRTLRADYDMNIHQMSKTTQFAKDLIKSLLKAEPGSRLTAKECLQHKWLQGGIRRLPHMNSVIELETSFMKKCLARRRWYRAYNSLQVSKAQFLFNFHFQSNLLQVIYKIRKLSSIEFKSGQDYERYNAERLNLRSLVIKEDLSSPTEFSKYQERYESLSQIGSGTFGRVFLLKDRSSSELAAAKFLRQNKEKVRLEADILFKLIESSFVVQLIGLYESPLDSILVTEYLAGGDLVTRYFFNP